MIEHMQEIMENFLRIYKIPLIFGSFGFFFFFLAVMVSNNSASKNLRGISIEGDLSDSTKSAEMVTMMLIDIEGAVGKPGVYEMKEGTRVVDLLERAGGISDQADDVWIAQSLNKAQPLVDGVKIYIPFEGQGLKSQSSNDVSKNTLGIRSTDKKININSASSSELEGLSGIGPVTASEIINGRPYTRVEELLERKILGPKTFEKIKEEISVF